jgi:hypothetical protein
MQQTPAYTNWVETQNFSSERREDFLINPNFDMISHLVTPYVFIMQQERFFTGQSLSPYGFNGRWRLLADT